jgi:hypothetical protein
MFLILARISAVALAIAVLAGCSKGPCETDETTAQVLGTIALAKESTARGLANHHGVRARIDGIRELPRRGDRLACEGTASVEGSPRHLFGIIVYQAGGEAQLRLAAQIDRPDIAAAVDLIEDIRRGIARLDDDLAARPLTVTQPVAYTLSEDGQQQTIIDAQHDEPYYRVLAAALQPVFDEQAARTAEVARQARQAKREHDRREAERLGYRDVDQYVIVTERERSAIETRSRALASRDELDATLQQLLGELAEAEAEAADATRLADAEALSLQGWERSLQSGFSAAPNPYLVVDQLRIVRGRGILAEWTLEGRARNMTKGYLDHGRVAGIFWTERTGAFSASGLFLFLGKDGLAPGAATPISITLDSMALRGGAREFGSPDFTASKNRGAVIYLEHLKDGSSQPLALEPWIDQRKRADEAAAAATQVAKRLATVRDAIAQARASIAREQRSIDAAEAELMAVEAEKPVRVRVIGASTESSPP